MEVTVSREGKVEVLGRGEQVEQVEQVEASLPVICLDRAGEGRETPGEEGEGLDSLISVAEAFERSQQPDFNDIASPVVDGTDTERHLVRNCVICGKALLGRNALGRHLKNVHPKVFGPYRCSHPGCGKLVESGTKMVSRW